MRNKKNYTHKSYCIVVFVCLKNSLELSYTYAHNRCMVIIEYIGILTNQNSPIFIVA